MYVVVECDDSLPSGHKAMGFGIAYALFDSKKEAMEYQLSQGIRKHTMVVEE